MAIRVRTYAAYGLTIHSAIEIPGASPVALSPGTRADIAVVEDVVDRSAGDRRLGPYDLTGDVLRFEIPGVAVYRCDGGTRVIIDPFPSGNVTDRAACLIAGALPALLWQRGDIVLHAAAAQMPANGATVAIGGPSGSGKSTVLAQVLVAGGSCIGDDTLRVRLMPEGVVASGLPAAYFLAEGTGVSGAGRPLHPVPSARRVASASLDRLLILGPRVEGPAQFRAVPPVEACEALLRSRHRPLVPRVLGRERDGLATLARLAERLSVHEWRRRDNAPRLCDREIEFLTRPNP